MLEVSRFIIYIKHFMFFFLSWFDSDLASIFYLDPDLAKNASVLSRLFGSLNSISLRRSIKLFTVRSSVGIDSHTFEFEIIRSSVDI